MRSYKYIFISIFSIIAILLFAELLRRRVGTFAGAYPFAEKWRIDAPLDSVKKAILNLQLKEPSLFPMGDTTIFEKDFTNYYLKINFYYKDSQEIVHTLIRDWKKEKTTLALVEFQKADNNEIKKMKRDFNFFENRRQIKKFENFIYDKILDELKGKSEIRIHL